MIIEIQTYDGQYTMRRIEGNLEITWEPFHWDDGATLFRSSDETLTLSISKSKFPTIQLQVWPSA